MTAGTRDATGEVVTDYAAASPRGGLAILFIVTILTGSFLLFLIQPMVARLALPELGGSPSVWNSAMLVYQGLLLAGYYYAHRLSKLAPKRQAIIHVGLFLFAALWLPIGLIVGAPEPGVSPVLWVPWMLLASIGPVFLVVSAQAPLVQSWYALAGNKGEPYALYAASNFGSFAGLIAYPLLVEPKLGTEGQSVLWSSLYGLLALMMAGCAWLIAKRHGRLRTSEEHAALPVAELDSHALQAQQAAKPELRERLIWILLAAVPSGLMLSTTTHLTTDIFATPLLWVVPLGIYLLSFTIAFANFQAPAVLIRNIAPYAMLGILGVIAMLEGNRTLTELWLSLALLAVVAIALHSEMYRRRPAPEYLTGFYLMMSIGGALGGLFCGLIAPLIFDWVYEHPILLVAAAALMPGRANLLAALGVEPKSAKVLRMLSAAIAVGVLVGYAHFKDGNEEHMVEAIALLVVGLFALGERWVFATVIACMLLISGGMQVIDESLDGMRSRSYFGVYTVRDYPEAKTRVLVHGTTLHGRQSTDPGHETEVSSYYGRSSGVGRTLDAAPALFGKNARVGIVGLGTGTLACYRRPGQDWTFFEIDPEIVRIATNPKRFTYLSRCAPKADIELGDARLSLANGKPDRFDVIAVDAFSSDAIPMHLLTREAFGVYRRALTKDGLLLVHISNRYIDLIPVLIAEADKGKWATAQLYYTPSVEEVANGETASQWIALANNEAALKKLTGPLPANGDPNAKGWQTLPDATRSVRWTDSFSSVLPLIRGLN